MPELFYSSFDDENDYTHYLFRFPAKFHPAVLRKLIDSFTKRGDNILDPFCGSGTLLVESLLSGRSALGIDVDPVAVLVSRAKSTAIPHNRLARQVDKLLAVTDMLRRGGSEYDRLIHDDFSPSSVVRLRAKYSIPAIPNINHWFRRYVSIDLARLKAAILDAPLDADVRRFLLACFAGVIRNASNADPVPVSGLEVTSHMLKRDKAGRRIDPFELFEKKVRQGLRGMSELAEASQDVKIRVRRGSATALSGLVNRGSFDAVISSPPYNLAVDYYRRHTLEMYWLGLVTSQDERRELATKYVGRAGVRVGSSLLRVDITNAYLTRLLKHARDIDQRRERALKHYAVSMNRSLQGMKRALRPKGKAVLVVGNAKWNGRSVRATKLLEELARPDFNVVGRFSYPVKNRYMSYSRHNGADVNREYVLVLEKKK